MAEIVNEGDTLVILLHGWERVWTWRRKIVVPISRIQSVRLDPEIASARPPFGSYGLIHVPKVITAGSYNKWGHREFWSVRHPDNAIVIDTAGDFFNRLVVEVESPLETIETVESAMSR